MALLDIANGILWHDYVLFAVLAAGILFSVWSRFAQFRSLTHGVRVIAGHYDRDHAPGAISHFQALSAALSATVGLGNIAGVAIAVSLGGPGAVFWMWVTGLIGMALKMTEVTQAMLFRRIDPAGLPHGGAMWVASRGFALRGRRWAAFGRGVAVVFCLTLLVSTVTGGNMFQAWNVNDISRSYFGMPPWLTGAIQATLVGLVILGGIRRIGAVAGKLVPVMCGLYILAGLWVIFVNLDEVPQVLRLVVVSAFTPSEAEGAFLGGVAGWAFLRGMQRALFSNEAGQGSAPIAHAAARTEEPVREGIVAGLEPFIDTLCVCTVTALVILLSGVWNRPPDALFVAPPTVTASAPGLWSLTSTPLVSSSSTDDPHPWSAGDTVFTVVAAHADARRGSHLHRLYGRIEEAGAAGRIVWEDFRSDVPPVLSSEGFYIEYKGATLTARAFDRAHPGLGLILVPAVAWLFALSTMISWSYYGEQGVIYLLGSEAVRAYRVLYCACILVASTPLIRTEAELDTVSTFGTGLMLVINLPLMLVFGATAMRACRDYLRRLDAGEFDRH